MAEPPSRPEVFEFGPYRLELRERRLLLDGQSVPLRAKLFETLAELVARAGTLVTREELIAAVWPDTVVEESNLSHNISVLRRLLDDGETPWIETVPKQGYRFRDDVRITDAAGTSAHYREPVVRLRPEPPEPGTAPLRQEIRFCLTADGVELAYSTVGKGPPLVKAANWLNHLEFDFESPIWKHVIHALAAEHTLVRYDERGNGLSDWNPEELSFTALVDDLETVVDALSLERFPLFGISQGCAVAVAYAVRHPDRVSRLILHGGYHVGWRLRGTPNDVSRRDALQTLILEGWGLENPAFRQVFTSLYMPDATESQSRSFNDLQRISAAPENAARLSNVLSTIDVRELLPKVRVPALVLHSTGDAAVPFSCGRYLAAHIPGARFVPLDSRSHLVLEQDPAWSVLRDSILDFLEE